MDELIWWGMGNRCFTRKQESHPKNNSFFISDKHVKNLKIIKFFSERQQKTTKNKKQTKQKKQNCDKVVECPGSSRWNWKLSLGGTESTSKIIDRWARAIANGHQSVKNSENVMLNYFQVLTWRNSPKGQLKPCFTLGTSKRWVQALSCSTYFFC